MSRLPCDASAPESLEGVEGCQLPSGHAGAHEVMAGRIHVFDTTMQPARSRYQWDDRNSVERTHRAAWTSPTHQRAAEFWDVLDVSEQEELAATRANSSALPSESLRRKLHAADLDIVLVSAADEHTSQLVVTGELPPGLLDVIAAAMQAR